MTVTPISVSTVYSAVSTNEVSGNATTADSILPPKNGANAGWTIGFDQEDFHTNLTVAQKTLEDALVASGQFDKNNADLIATALNDAGTSSNVDWSGIQTISGTALTSINAVGIVNAALQTSAASVKISQDSSASFGDTYTALNTNVFQNSSLDPAVQAALADPTEGPLLQIVLADFNNQYGIQTGGAMMNLLTSGTASIGGNQITLDTTNAATVTQGVMDFVLSTAWVAKGYGGAATNRLAEDVSVANGYDLAQGLTLPGTMDFDTNNGSAVITTSINGVTYSGTWSDGAATGTCSVNLGNTLDLSGLDNTVDLNAAPITMANGAAAVLTGYNDSTAIGFNDTLTLDGSGNTVTGPSNPTSSTGNTITVASPLQVLDYSYTATVVDNGGSATLSGNSNSSTVASGGTLSIVSGSSSNTVTATGAATVNDSGVGDSTTAANGSTVNIQNTSGNTDSVTMNYGTVNLGTDVVGNVSGQHDTVNVQAGSDANTGGTSLTVNMLGAGSNLVDTGTNDSDIVDAANITAYLQGAGSSISANSASDGLILQAANQTGTLQGTGGSITAYGNTSAIIMDGSGETGSMYGSNGAITIYGAGNGSYLEGVNTTDALMGGNDGAIVQNHNDGVYVYSNDSGAALTNSDLGSWLTGTFTTGGETVGVNASINSNGTISYSESSSGNYSHSASGTVSLASDVLVNDGSYFANTLNSASAGSVTDLYNVSNTISENDLNYTGLNDAGLLTGETIFRVSLPTLSIVFDYVGTTEANFTVSEAGVGSALFADNGSYEAGTTSLASAGGYGAGDGGASDDGFDGDGFSGDDGEFELANTSSAPTAGSGNTPINFSNFNVALPQNPASLTESNAAENEINTIEQLTASGFNTDQPFYEGGRWAPGTTITWSMASLGGPDASPFSSYMGPQYTSLVQQAFAEWASASGLTFAQVADSAQSDIRVGFGDFNTAQSGVVGYTTYQYKDSLLQPDVIVRVEDPTQTALSGSGANATYTGTNSAVYQDILHEIGHALGLGDNNDPNSVMYYQAGASNVTLDANDINGLQTLYGANSPLAPSASLSDEISVNSMVHQMVQANASYLASSSVGVAASSAAVAEAQSMTLAANATH